MKGKTQKTRLSFMVVSLVLLLIQFNAFAAVPQTINYQGYLTNSSGQPVNGTVSIIFSLYDVQTGGTALWSEAHANVNVTNGVYSVILGSVNPINLAFDVQYYLGVKVGDDAEMLPRQALTSVPYAMRAKVADDNVKKAGDSMTGALNISTNANHALAVTQTGSNLVAGYFKANNASSQYPAIRVESYGLGNAGSFAVFNPSMIEPALISETNGSGEAILGRNTGTGKAGTFDIDNPSSNSDVLSAWTNGTGVVANFSTSGTGRSEPVLKVESGGSGPAAVLYGDVGMHGVVTVYGTLSSTGTINGLHTGGATLSELIVNGSISGNTLNISGTKNFVQPHPKDPSKELVYVAMEGPESAIFLRGKATLVKGKATIETPEYFKAVAGENDITVQFTPRSSKSKGLAATKVTKDKVVVTELMNGKGTYEFDYFITAKRAGFEKHEPIQSNTHFTADMSTKEEFEKKYSKTDDMAILAMRNLLISNGILTADGKLNKEVAQKLGWKIKEADLAKIRGE